MAEDIASKVAIGTPVMSVAPGVVRFSKYKPTLGHVVTIEHGLPDGTSVTSVYMHMTNPAELPTQAAADLPKAESAVGKGTVIGYVTGNLEDNFKHVHLHFGIRNEGLTGYKGNVALDEKRTVAPFYVGYSSFFNPTAFTDVSGYHPRGTVRRCDYLDGGGNAGIAADKVMADHNQVVADWLQPAGALAPRQFIQKRLGGTSFFNLYSFGAKAEDGANPIYGLIRGSDGNLYGATSQGGKFGKGTIFRFTPAGVESVLYSFAGGADGSSPTGVFQAKDGNLYGTTLGGGGANNIGTVFKITPAGIETRLHAFNGGVDGGGPNGLIQGTDGNFYGTTTFGGQFNHGTVFKITPAGIKTLMYSFAGGADGGGPLAGLTEGSAGTFYGTTGNEGNGTVFKITATGAKSTVYSFGGLPDGANPAARLFRDGSGNLFGTTLGGGQRNVGTVFKITPAGTEEWRYSFPDASNVLSGLTRGSNGNFFGTVLYTDNNQSSGGIIFTITPAGNATTLYRFVGSNSGSVPSGEMMADSAGILYGVTSAGGKFGKGTLFKVIVHGN